MCCVCTWRGATGRASEVHRYKYYYYNTFEKIMNENNRGAGRVLVGPDPSFWTKIEYFTIWFKKNESLISPCSLVVVIAVSTGAGRQETYLSQVLIVLYPVSAEFWREVHENLRAFPADLEMLILRLHSAHGLLHSVNLLLACFVQ